jgi:uncharacterized protein with PIN domain
MVQVAESMPRPWFGPTVGTIAMDTKQPPIVRCPGCNQPMEAKERTLVRQRLVDIRYVCAGCGMETKRTLAEEAH